MAAKIIINLNKIQENAKEVVEKCKQAAISVAGVTKMHCADKRISQALLNAGVAMLADSRIENLEVLQDFVCEKMLIRIPCISESESVVRFADISLNSEIDTVFSLNAAAKKLEKKHGVILLYDLGDLREGFFDSENLFEAVERILKMEYINLRGVGTSLTCYGGILPTVENLNQLTAVAETIENRYGINLDIISGGSSTRYTLISDCSIPKRINNLRIGDTIYCGRDDSTRLHINGMHDDCFILEAEIVEIKEKPSIPIGQKGYSSLNRKPEFEDKGIRKRVICSVGRQDIDLDMTPFDKDAFIMEASSDHLLVDITDSSVEYHIGDKMRFKMLYASIMRSFTSKFIKKEYIG